MEEKSIEVLEAELASLKKENLEREVAAEQAKLADAKKAEETKEHEMLYAKIESEVMEKLGQVSQIVPDDKPATLQHGGKTKFNLFLDRWSENHGLKQQKYNDWVHDLCNKQGYMEK